MKVRAQTAAALAIAGAYAQESAPTYDGTPAVTPPVSYTTVTYDDCPTSDIATMITVTNGITVTYCPECEHETPKPTTKKPGHTTVYTTTYLSLCPTGTVPVTYTVTESCEEETPTWTPGPSHVPQGFTVTVKECTACEGGDKTPVPVTITEPCDCDATSGTPVAPKPTGNPIEQIPDGQVQNPAPTGKPIEQIPDGQVQNPAPTGGNMPPAPGSSNSGDAPPYPTDSATTVKCPGPDCRAKATGGAAGPTDSPTTPPTDMGGEGGGDSPAPSDGPGTAPFEGSAASYSAAGFVTISVMVAALAFAL
ncbi:uncharacterized protein MYCFIDRAFT_198503 [Pseudocercospora fijiensis CIRAD86]|uniref:Uncharacterized protein n=1 Tax=Pseudocercospora fijiensis (strain CIRAD86) TaxID=383855 RepID=M3ARY5_PSEFD|nr:uncharacterized protein MYCFIDRAFT_198503 [Pseudocercospora fijiensis CIRAD86]EME80217.1 hypothetical protein MYCFIDRAFT_198503 [Pseudocercospora fijiensis CIRAD86]